MILYHRSILSTQLWQFERLTRGTLVCATLSPFFAPQKTQVIARLTVFNFQSFSCGTICNWTRFETDDQLENGLLTVSLLSVKGYYSTFGELRGAC